MMPVVRTPMEGGGGGPHGPTGGSISLGLLIDFIVQRTYHDLTVLTELLPRKNDMERKIEIVQFASRTRQLCIRLLALVKWAGSVSKVDKSASIMAFLDKQSMLFVDTADKLSLMARQDLVAARLPTFHIPAAVEVLTTGNYSRLPLCIREKIVPPKPITPTEQTSTLQRLNQIIEHRLVTSDLPPQMLQLKIGAGRVRITVQNEFQVSLTLMGDGPSVPWTLLEIDVLVEDKETGEGKSLVHPLQVHYLHQLVSSYLSDSARPLYDIYTILHSFCLSLQLEVLHSQVAQLCRDRLGDNVRVHDYQPGRLLTVAYWREVTGRSESRSEPGYRVTLQTDPADSGRPLLVTHAPPLPDSRAAEQAERAVRAERLSIERLLVHTIHLRSRAVLAEARTQLAKLVQLPEQQLQLAGSPAVLSVPLLQPCLKGEHMLVAVDVHRGKLTAHVPLYDTPVVEEVAAALNSDRSALKPLLSKLRFWVTLRRAEKTLQHLPASAHEGLPLSYREGHPLGRLPAQQLYVRLHRFPSRVLVVVCQERPSSPNQMEYSFYMVTIKPCSIEDGSEDANERHLPKKYLKVLTFVELDTFLCLHGPGTQLVTSDKTRQRTPSAPGSPSRSAPPAYFIQELAQVVALCDEQIPFAALCCELSRQSVPHGGAAVDPSGQSRYIRLIDLPTVPDVEPSAMQQLRRALLSATVTQQEDKLGSRWAVELVFHGAPARSRHPREQASRRPVHYLYPQPGAEAVSVVVERFLADWRQLAQLYGLLLSYQQFVGEDRQRGLSQIAEISSYNYRSVTLAYGPNKGATVKVEYSSEEKRFRLGFGINARSSSATNPHAVLSSQMEDLLNAERCLAQLMVALDETYSPLVSLDKLSATPRLGVRGDRPLEPVTNFILLPQSAWHVRVVYRRTYWLSVQLHSDGLVSVRDGAFCVFDRSRPLEELLPLQNLAAFLVRYAADPAFTGGGGEDDTPPSPTSLELDTPSSLPPPAAKAASPAAGREPGRFAHPLTPGSLSNPHTPASPLQPSPAAPPQQQLVSNSPGAPLHAPSPGGGFLPAPSPSHVGHSPAAAGAMSPFTAQPLTSPAVAAAASPAVSKATAAHVRPAAAPVMLTHESFDMLCTRSPAPASALRTAPELTQVSPLERYLGCVYLRTHLKRALDDDSLGRVPCSEQGVTLFKTVCVQCRVRLEPEHVQTLHLSVQPNPDSMEQWQPDELQVLERFFETRVAVAPYRQNTLKTFVRILNTPANVLRDFIRIMQLGEITADANNPQAASMNWSVEWCTTSHPAAAPALIPTGLVSLINATAKLLFFLQLTRRVAAARGAEPARIVLPIVYHLSDNITQCADRKDYQPNQAMTLINQLMRRSSEMAVQAGECSIFPAVRDVVTNFLLPSEQSAAQQQQAAQQQPVPPPIGSDGTSAQLLLQQRQFQQQQQEPHDQQDQQQPPQQQPGVMQPPMPGAAAAPRDRLQ